jgi:hypothetical protein
MDDIQLRGILEFCRRNNRVCPMPPEWHSIWKLLPNREGKKGGWSPPLPLILAGWLYTTDSEKRQRLEEHIRWAYEHHVCHKVSTFIRSLSEKQWHHSQM